jgi:hypothetical protein
MWVNLNASSALAEHPHMCVLKLPNFTPSSLIVHYLDAKSTARFINNIVLDNLIRFISQHSIFSVGSNPFLKMDLDRTKLKSMSISY